MKVTSCLYCGNRALTKITERSDNNSILQCSRCSIMMVEETADDIEKLYTAEYFEKDDASHKGYTDYFSSPIANVMGKYAFARLFARQSGKHLDLGCADGSLMEIFSSNGFMTHGLEISEDAIKVAQSKGLQVEQSNLHAFPKKLPKFDLITAYDIFEHVDRPGDTLQQVRSSLEDDGYLVFSTLCVKNLNQTDYWFNNSLEHYVYFTPQSLAYVLEDIFGKRNFAFAEVTINGVSELWGVAKKGPLTHEASLITRIQNCDVSEQDPSTAYLLSLLYNQLGRFRESERIITAFQKVWPAHQSAQARFYTNFSQGKFEAVVSSATESKHLIPSTDVAYWQALSHSNEELYKLKEEAYKAEEEEMVREFNEQIWSLRGDVFRLRDELQNLKNARLLGKIIKARDSTGRISRMLVRLPARVVRGVVRRIRNVVAPFIPGPLRRAIKRTAKKIIHFDYRARFATTKIVTNVAWPVRRPLVSVVIPYYNRADTVDDTLESLKIQTFTDFEVLVVNDGSPDEASVQKLKELNTDGLRLRIIHQANQGVAAARNKGISEAKGKYIICLDSDDVLEPTFIEKSTVALETDPEVDLVGTDRTDFGVLTDRIKYIPYDPVQLFSNNMIITAAEFTKRAWKSVGGYKSGIGYEDWEFWMSLGEHGYWGKVIPEPLFRYRTSLQSRFVDDKDIHWDNLKRIRALHPKYKRNVKRLLSKRAIQKRILDVKSAFVNLGKPNSYAQPNNRYKNVLIAMPWMTFGGAETLVANFCLEVKDAYNLSFVTGLASDHEWEYKFKEITPNVYHLANLFADEHLRLEFISNYIVTRNIDVLHIVHNSCFFAMLPELRRRHPNLKVVLTLFNTRAHFEESISAAPYIDQITSDNAAVERSLKERLGEQYRTKVIPNGINCYEGFNPELFDRQKERTDLGLEENDVAVFFVGRLSPEKNPDVFLNVAKRLLDKEKADSIKFFVIGDGPMRAEIDKLLSSIKSKNVTDLGYQSPAEVARFLSAADVFVLPSSIEGFPLSLLEAMAMRVTVVASDVGAVAEVVTSGKDGYVVKPGSAEEISDIIRLLNGDRRLLEQSKEMAREKVEKKYSNKILGHNYRDLYTNL